MKCFFSVITVYVLCLALSVQGSSAEADIPDRTAYTYFDNVTTVTSLDSSASEVHPARQKWKMTEKLAKKLTSDVVRQILRFAVQGAEDLKLSPVCMRHMMKFLTGLKQMKMWAFRMIDASGKLPNGILGGTITSLGDFDGCLQVNASGQFRGKYCTVEILPPVPERRPFVPVDEVIPEFENFSEPGTLIDEFVRKAQHYYYLSFRTSVCLPSTCSEEDAQAIASKVMDATLGWDVRVPRCEVDEAPGLDTREIVVICAIGVVVLAAALGTIIDVVLKLRSDDESYKTDSGIIVRILLCFSFYSNTVRLLKKDDSPDTIKIIHGIKVFTVMWVILNHTYYYINLQVFNSLLHARVKGSDIAFQFILNGFLNVETFFFISGVLIIYGRMKAADKDFTVFLYIFRRLWRLTPPFMFVIAATFLIHHMGSGPVWHETVGTLVEKCRKNWWTNLLYFNNFVRSEEMCLQWLWYVPVDTHLYLLALLVVIPIKKRPVLAFLILGVIFILSIVVTAANHIFYELTPTAIYAFPHPDDINYYVDHGYFRTYLHSVTYCIGMAVGYVLSKKPKLRIHWAANIFGWLTAFVMALTVVYGVRDWNQGNLPSLTIATLYACTNKIVWALALGWVTICCFTGNGGIVSSFLSWSGFVPLSRLTYMAYLVHPLIQHMYIGSTRVPLQTEHRTMAFLFLAYVVAAYMAAYVFSQLFESPFMALEKVFFAARRKRPSLEPAKSEARSENHFSKSTENGIYAIKMRKTDVEP